MKAHTICWFYHLPYTVPVQQDIYGVSLGTMIPSSPLLKVCFFPPTTVYVTLETVKYSS